MFAPRTRPPRALLLLTTVASFGALQCRVARGPGAVPAQLHRLGDPAAAGRAARFEAFEAGGGGLVTRMAVRLEGVGRPVVVREGVQVTFARSGGFIEVTPAALGLPEDWERWRKLVLRARPGAGTLRVELAVIGARNRIVAGRELSPAGGEVEVDLTELPLAAGVRPPWQPTAVRVTARFQGAVARELGLLSLVLTGEGPWPPVAMVDGYGQRRGADWPGKVRSPDELRASAVRDQAQLATWEPLPNRSVYGGWTGGPMFSGTGFFRLQKDGVGRDWLVDPQGHPFWSHGVTGVRTVKEVTPVRGREALFAALPGLTGPDRLAYVDGDDRGPGAVPDPALVGAAALARPTGGVSFYRWNVLRKWGSLDAWRDTTLERLRRFGINTLGAFTYERALFDARKVPYTRFFRTLSGGPAPLFRTRTGFPDVFDPRWAAHVDQQTAGVATPHRQDPWLLGYFVDNEPRWNLLQLLSVPPGAPLRARWRAFLEERHATPAALAQAWRAPLRSWQEVAQLQESQLPEAARNDLRAFEGVYAEAYYATVAAALRKHAGDHLYLGSRFVRELPDNELIVRAAGRHVDVMSVNCYSMVPEEQTFRRWHALGGRPLLIGEHHKPLLGARQLPPDNARALEPADRAVYYQRYVETFAAFPFAVGAHWFQYVDQPLTGRAGNGENQIVGFVDVTDQPHLELVEAARRTASRVYQVHASSRIDP